MNRQEHRPPAAAILIVPLIVAVVLTLFAWPSAFVAASSGAKVLTSSAGSPAVAQLLTHAAAEQDAEVEDVVTTTPAASGLGSSVLPLVLAGIVTGVLAALAGSRGT